MNKVIASLLVILVFISGTARAGQTNATPERKSPTTATNMALLGFLVPIGLVAMGASASADGSDDATLILMGLAGSIVGPGLGHSYAGDSGRFWRGVGLRTLAYGGVAAAVAMSWDDPDAGGAAALAIGMTVLYLYSSFYDIATASDSANRYNEKHSTREVTVAPLWVPRDRAAGLGVSWAF